MLVAFDVAVVRAQYPALRPEVAEALSARGINCWHRYSYTWELAGALGLGEGGGEGGGAVRTKSDLVGLDIRGELLELQRVLASVVAAEQQFST